LGQEETLLTSVTNRHEKNGGLWKDKTREEDPRRRKTEIKNNTLVGKKDLGVTLDGGQYA